MMTRALTRFLGYGSDLAIWLWTILFKGDACHPYNVGSDKEITVANLARTVASTLGGTVMDTTIKSDLPLSRYIPATERIMSELELEIPISLIQALIKTHDYSKTVT